MRRLAQEAIAILMLVGWASGASADPDYRYNWTDGDVCKHVYVAPDHDFGASIWVKQSYTAGSDCVIADDHRALWFSVVAKASSGLTWVTLSGRDSNWPNPYWAWGQYGNAPYVWFFTYNGGLEDPDRYDQNGTWKKMVNYTLHSPAYSGTFYVQIVYDAPGVTDTVSEVQVVDSSGYPDGCDNRWWAFPSSGASSCSGVGSPAPSLYTQTLTVHVGIFDPGCTHDCQELEKASPVATWSKIKELYR
jgi:hypothetical protein